jgi:hypothetical protein
VSLAQGGRRHLDLEGRVTAGQTWLEGQEQTTRQRIVVDKRVSEVQSGRPLSQMSILRMVLEVDTVVAVRPGSPCQIVAGQYNKTQKSMKV